jgi:CubicO group peptidase (beta-lactamase class C family)
MHFDGPHPTVLFGFIALTAAVLVLVLTLGSGRPRVPLLRLLLLWVLGLGLSACGEPENDGRFGGVRSALRTCLQSTAGATGASISITRGEEVLFEAAEGTRSYGFGAPQVLPETLFKMESVSKTVAALTALRLVEEGRLNLDARIADVLPGWTLERSPEFAARMTVRHLLNHSTCIDDTAVFNPEGDSPQAVIEEQMPGKLVSICPPGSLWLYSNRGYWILGRIIERAAGTSYREAAQTRVLDALGLKRSALSLADARQRGMATQHEVNFFLDPMPAAVGESSSYSLASEALYSNVREYPRVIRAMAQPGLLSQGSRDAITQSLSRTGAPGEGWGLGVQVFDGGYPVRGGRTRWPAIQHTGGYLGASTHALHLPVQDVTVTVLVNGPDASTYQVVAAALEAMELTEPIEPFPPPRPNSEYVGRYENALAQDAFQMKWMEVSEAGGELRVRGAQGSKSFSGTLVPLRENVFALNAGSQFNQEVSFLRGEDDRPRFLRSNLFALTRVDP